MEFINTLYQRELANTLETRQYLRCPSRQYSLCEIDEVTCRLFSWRETYSGSIESFLGVTTHLNTLLFYKIWRNSRIMPEIRLNVKAKQKFEKLGPSHTSIEQIKQLIIDFLGKTVVAKMSFVDAWTPLSQKQKLSAKKSMRLNNNILLGNKCILRNAGISITLHYFISNELRRKLEDKIKQLYPKISSIFWVYHSQENFTPRGQASGRSEKLV